MNSDYAAPRPYGRISSLRAVVVFACTALIGTLVSFSDRPGLYALVLVLFTLVAAPAWLDWNRGKLDYFEPIHVVGLLCFTYFGLGAIWTVQNPRVVAYDRYIDDYIAISVFYCVLGYIALLIGYYGADKIVQTAVRPALSTKGIGFLLCTGGVGLVGHLSHGILDVASARHSTFPRLLGTLAELAPLFGLAWGLGWLLFFASRDTLAQRCLLLLVWVPGVALIAYSNFANKSLLMTLAGMPLIALWYARRKIAWRSLVIMLMLLVFVVFPLYNAYRWSDVKAGRGERLSSTVEMIQNWDTRAFMDFSLGGFKRRMALINSVAIIVRDAGRHVPFANGETILLPVVTFIVPSLIWPDKPLVNPGREFGRKFRITNSLTAESHIAPTLPGELYWNFGLPGIIIGMALFGLVIRFFYRRYGQTPGLDPFNRAIHILLLARLAQLEGSIAMQAVAIVRILIMVELLRWLGRRTGMLEVDAGMGSVQR